MQAKDLNRKFRTAAKKVFSRDGLRTARQMAFETAADIRRRPVREIGMILSWMFVPVPALFGAWVAYRVHRHRQIAQKAANDNAAPPEPAARNTPTAKKQAPPAP